MRVCEGGQKGVQGRSVYGAVRLLGLTGKAAACYRDAKHIHAKNVRIALEYCIDGPCGKVAHLANSGSA